MSKNKLKGPDVDQGPKLSSQVTLCPNLTVQKYPFTEPSILFSIVFAIVRYFFMLYLCLDDLSPPTRKSPPGEQNLGFSVLLCPQHTTQH